jgi:hypothetical protein
MNGFGGSVVSGIISGLIATFLAVVVRTFWMRAVVPWYEERVYRDAKIEGRWRSRVEYSDAPEDWDEFIVEITRMSHRVESLLTCVDGANKGNVYKFSGTFGNLILTGSYASIDPARLARGTLTLRLIKDGQAMEGYGAVYSPIKGYIFFAKVELERQA